VAAHQGGGHKAKGGVVHLTPLSGHACRLWALVVRKRRFHAARVIFNIFTLRDVNKVGFIMLAVTFVNLCQAISPAIRSLAGTASFFCTQSDRTPF
jgi:hypothetical protein